MNGSNTKTIIIVVILIAAGVAGYYGFARDTTNGPTTSISMPGIQGGPMGMPNTIPGTLPTSIDSGQDIAALLAELNGLKIDNTLFDSSDYKALVDYTVIISPIPIGRPNPFAPLVNPASQQQATSTLKLLAPKTTKAKK